MCLLCVRCVAGVQVLTRIQHSETHQQPLDKHTNGGGAIVADMVAELE